MKAAKAVIAIVGLFFSIPIALYLQYQILMRVNASDVMWLLFWVNLPVMILINILSKVVELTDK